MKLVKFLALVLWSSPLVFSQQIIPEPVAQQKALGEFVLTADTRIHIPKGNPEVRKIAEFLAMTLAIPTGVKLPVLETPKIGNISILSWKVHLSKSLDKKKDIL
jgi:hypothetical protein